MRVPVLGPRTDGNHAAMGDLANRMLKLNRRMVDVKVGL